MLLKPSFKKEMIDGIEFVLSKRKESEKLQKERDVLSDRIQKLSAVIIDELESIKGLMGDMESLTMKIEGKYYKVFKRPSGLFDFVEFKIDITDE